MIRYKKFISFLLPWFILALMMNIARFLMTDVQSYVYMNWNLFLALLPLFFVYLFEKVQNQYGKAFLFFLWLFFLPNAIYLVTDFIHLREVGSQWMLWYDAMMLFAYALMGVFISAYVLLRMGYALFSHQTKKKKIFFLLISLLVAFGIYLGRYIRWNTWDILVRPLDLSNTVLDILHTGHTNPLLVSTLIFFTLLSCVSIRSLQVFMVDEEK